MSLFRPLVRDLSRGLVRGVVGGGGSSLDPDSRPYIEAIEAADNTPMATPLRKAWDDFVVGCKADTSLVVGVSNWDAIKTLHFLGFGFASTFAGSLVWAKGSTGSSFSFVESDWNRITGFKGDGLTKYIFSGRTNQDDPQNNKHLSVWVTEFGSATRSLIGNGGSQQGVSQISYEENALFRYIGRINYTTGTAPVVSSSGIINDLVCFSRYSSTVSRYVVGDASGELISSNISASPFAGNINVFRRGSDLAANDRIGAYSIGEAVDPVLLRNRFRSLWAAIREIFPTSIQLSSPVAYQTFQRGDDGLSDIAISGTYGGYPTSIQARWNGGAWATIVASPSGGNFTGILPAQTAGQGTLEVRFANDHSISASAAFVGIGEVILCAGQSNMSGRATSNQLWTHPTLRLALLGNDNVWKLASDPYDSATGQIDTISSDTGARGSAILYAAGLLMAELGVPIALIPAARGGTSIGAWQPNANHLLRSTLYGSANYRAQLAGGVRCVVWWQGETNSEGAGMPQATYNSNFDNIANAFAADLGVKMMPALLQNCSGSPIENQNAINAAILEAVSDNANVLAGPDFRDLTTDDTFHLMTNAKVQEAGVRWFDALMSAFYS